MKSLHDKITLNLKGNEKILVRGTFTSIEYTKDNFHVEWEELANLRVVVPEKQYATSVFQGFLPNEPVLVGETWRIEEESVLDLLRQLHPDPHLVRDADSQGLWACLRAYDDKFADIAFRIHAEFALKGGWFTPSQFAGNLVIDRTQGKLVRFHMHVPQTILNFDVGWDTIGCTDIGFCPKIELCAGTQPDVEYDISITREAAERTLILCFYKSEQINWVPPDQAVAIAEEQVKLIHVISIDGPLTDEAC